MFVIKKCAFTSDPCVETVSGFVTETSTSPSI